MDADVSHSRSLDIKICFFVVDSWIFLRSDLRIDLICSLSSLWYAIPSVHFDIADIASFEKKSLACLRHCMLPNIDFISVLVKEFPSNIAALSYARFVITLEFVALLSRFF